MKKGKLIVIEGTDCSGKETQTKLLIEKLKNDNIDVFTKSFPEYSSPTGKIIGGPVIGKKHICDSFFSDPANEPAKVISLYYAADRLYNVEPILESLNSGKIVLLDRYTQSNMAFQGSKFETSEERLEMFKFIETLEYDLLELPRPDDVIFLHMPYDEACILKQKRNELTDDVEASEKYLRRGEMTYLELAKLYNFKTVKCGENGIIRTIEDINDEIYKLVKEIIDVK